MSDEIVPVPEIPDGLREAQQRGVLIPFIGAGVSRLAGCPTWRELADGALMECIAAKKFTYGQLAQIKHLSPRVKLSIARGLELQFDLDIDYGTLIHPREGYEKNDAGNRVYRSLVSHGILGAALNANLEDTHSRERITEWICLAYLWGDETLESPLMAHIFAGGVDELQNAAEFFWRVHADKLKPEQIERILAFWSKSFDWAKEQPVAPATFLSTLGRLAPYLAKLDERAKQLLLGVVPYVQVDYSTDHMIRQLSRLVDTNPAATVELLERMFDAGTPNFDMDNKLKRLLEKLYGMSHRAEVLRCIEKLRKTLPGMLEFYKELVSDTSES